MAEPDASPAKDLRLGFVDMLQRLENLMRAKGEIFRAQAYKKAQDELLGSNTPITSAKQLERLPGIGATMLKKFDEYSKTGQLKALMKPEDQAWITLTGVHGIGPKKAKELISEGITTIEGLRKASTENANLLNAKQRMGLAHYEELQERIPREEIQRFEARLTEVWQSVVPKNDPEAEMMIVGSYRRGAASSGDIDVIITSGNDNMDIHKNFVKALQNSGVLTDLLSTGKTKTLAIGKLPDSNKHRRIDIMYSPPDEYPFAVLYFTGSRSFNIAMRNRALGMGYSLSEHGFIDTATKGKVEVPMKTEEDIFKFLGMKFKQPVERTGVLAVQAAEGAKPVARKTVKAKKAAAKTASAKTASAKTVKKRTVKDVRTPKPTVVKTPKTLVKTPKTFTKEEKKEEVAAEEVPAEDRDYIIIATDAPNPPFADFDEFGNVTGFNENIMSSIAEAGNFEYEFVVTPYEGVLTSLANGSREFVVDPMVQLVQQDLFLHPSLVSGESRHDILLIGTPSLMGRIHSRATIQSPKLRDCLRLNRRGGLVNLVPFLDDPQYCTTKYIYSGICTTQSSIYYHELVMPQPQMWQSPGLGQAPAL